MICDFYNKKGLHNFPYLNNIMTFSFRNSSAVEQWTVNPLVVGSNPTSGESHKAVKVRFNSLLFFHRACFTLMKFNETMKNQRFDKLEPITKMCLLISMYIRNEMEDFHCKHLSDEQMKELNPIIRQAVYNILLFLKLADSKELNSYIVAAQQIVNFQEQLLPDYWELPDPVAPWEELHELINVMNTPEHKTAIEHLNSLTFFIIL